MFPVPYAPVGHGSDIDLVLATEPPRAPSAGQVPGPGQSRLGSVELPPGRPLATRDQRAESPSPVLWVSDDEVSEPVEIWARLAEQFPSTSLWPLLLHGLGDGSGRPWASGELSPVAEAEIDALDPQTVLEDAWHGWLVPIDNPWAPGTGPLAPFGPGFPGLTAGQPASFDEVLPVDPGGSALLGLVSCRRTADAIALAGWYGSINRIGSAEVSAVLRSWEDRFGAVLVGLGFATITLLVTRPPTTEEDALHAAAEVAALCPDALWQPESQPSSVTRDCTLEAISRALVREPVWRLWFD